jgi:hypothetical protein
MVVELMLRVWAISLSRSFGDSYLEMAMTVSTRHNCNNTDSSVAVKSFSLRTLVNHLDYSFDTSIMTTWGSVYWHSELHIRWRRLRVCRFAMMVALMPSFGD